MSTLNNPYEPGHVWPHIRDLTLHLNVSPRSNVRGVDATGSMSKYVLKDNHSKAHAPSTAVCGYFYDVERHLR